MVCATCGVKFELMPCLARRARYCSRACAAEAFRALVHGRSCAKDRNHDEVRAAFTKLGCRVVDLSCHGYGLPDLLVGAHGWWHLVEVKNPKGTYGRKGLSDSQKRFAQQFAGGVDVVQRLDDVLALVEDWRRAAAPDELGTRPEVRRFGSRRETFAAILKAQPHDKALKAFRFQKQVAS